MLEGNQKKTSLFQLIFLIATFLAGLYLLFPLVDFQSKLSQGDHGRDLYAFLSTMKGDAPYRDYFWIYGPLMPYYYALIFNILGVTIQSAIFGKIFLLVAGAVIFYLALILISSPLLAFVGALWYLFNIDDFFYTYNHVGGLTCSLLMIYGILLYIKDKKNGYLYLSLIAAVILSFIKLNFGIISLLGVALSVFTINKVHQTSPFKGKKFFYFNLLVIVPIVITFGYALFFYQQPSYVVLQCLPFAGMDGPDRIPLAQGIMMSFQKCFEQIISNNPFKVFIAIFVVGTFFIKSSKNKPELNTNFKLFGTVCGIFYLLFMHEYAASGVNYRAIWAEPFLLLTIFIFIAFALDRFNRPIVNYGMILGIALLLYVQYSSGIGKVQALKTPNQYLSIERAKIYVGNDPHWHETVRLTTDFLNQHLEANEKFLAVPYDPLYYYLTNKKSPSQQLVFYDYIKIQPEQEKEIINTLKKDQVDWILLSSLIKAGDESLGTFGVTHARALGKYIYNHYEPMAEFGDWRNPPGWSTPHGTRILRRK